MLVVAQSRGARHTVAGTWSRCVVRAGSRTRYPKARPAATTGNSTFCRPGIIYWMLSNWIRSRVPVARATFSSVRVDGGVRPLSNRATADCVVFIRAAVRLALMVSRNRRIDRRPASMSVCYRLGRGLFPTLPREARVHGPLTLVRVRLASGDGPGALWPMVLGTCPNVRMGAFRQCGSGQAALSWVWLDSGVGDEGSRLS